jgi:hypothetical protein
MRFTLREKPAWQLPFSPRNAGLNGKCINMGIPNAMFDDTGGLQIAAARARRARRALLPVSRPEVGSSKNWPRPDLSMMEK